MGAMPPQTGQMPVKLSGTTLDGKDWSLADEKGKVVVVNVWGSWCGPCVAEAPDLQKAWDDISKAGKPVQFMGIDFREADAEALPFDDGVFDVVLSTFGCMFAPNAPRVAAEMLRVTRAGGRIGMANWTPEGFIGQLFKTIGKHVPPPGRG